MLLAVGQDNAIAAQLSTELADVENRFAAELISDLTCVNNLVAHVERYRGKMLRPMLVLVPGFAASSIPLPDGASDSGDVDDPSDVALPVAHRVVATVVEMVHMATLVHDDVLDDADTRRRGRTVNAMTGNEAAVMLGDYLISHAYHLCCSLGSPAISRFIADTTNTVCEGELLQLANRKNWELDEGTYFEMIRRKTAALTGACCRLGVMLHDLSDIDANLPLADALQSYGEKLGVAFQIVDDLLDLIGDQETVGKSLGRDIAKGKLTLPLIRYLKSATPEDRAAMLELIHPVRDDADTSTDDTGATVATIRRRLCDSDAIDYAKQWAQNLVEQAKSSLDLLPPSPAKELLGDMADAVVSRKK